MKEGGNRCLGRKRLVAEGGKEMKKKRSDIMIEEKRRKGWEI